MSLFRKVLCLALAVALLSLCSVPAFASSVDSSSVPVGYSSLLAMQDISLYSAPSGVSFSKVRVYPSDGSPYVEIPLGSNGSFELTFPASRFIFFPSSSVFFGSGSQFVMADLYYPDGFSGRPLSFLSLLDRSVDYGSYSESYSYPSFFWSSKGFSSFFSFISRSNYLNTLYYEFSFQPGTYSIQFSYSRSPDFSMNSGSYVNPWSFSDLNDLRAFSQRLYSDGVFAYQTKDDPAAWRGNVGYWLSHMGQYLGDLPAALGYTISEGMKNLSTYIGTCFSFLSTGFDDAFVNLRDNIVAAIWGTHQSGEQDLDDSYKSENDQAISDAQDQIDKVEQFEDDIFGQADQGMSDLNPSQVQAPSSIVSTMAWISNIWTSSFNVLPKDFQFVLTFPLFLGISLLMLGRGVHLADGPYKKDQTIYSSGRILPDDNRKIGAIDVKYKEIE